MSLVIFCFFFFSFSIYYVPVKGEIIWYLSLTVWLISLSVMLSSSIHAVRKLNKVEGGHVDILGKSGLGRRNSRSQCQAVGAHLLH